MTVYAWLDQALDFGAIWNDIVKRPYITVGFTAERNGACMAAEI